MKKQTQPIDMWHYESLALEQGYEVIAGTDEAGRGPLAGPVFAAAVVLPYAIDIPYLNDSKKLSEKRREELFDIICDKAVSFKVESADAQEIDRVNILNASLMSMKRASEGLSPMPDMVLIDGNQVRYFECAAQAIVKGDGLSASIAAASILAKVSRDRYMMELDELYPMYGFSKHKGYPTKAHYEALRKYGPSPVHRMSFLKKLNTTE